MKWLFVLFLAVIIFGGAAWFGYNLFFKQEIESKGAARRSSRGAVLRISVFPNFRPRPNCGRREKCWKHARPDRFHRKIPNGLHVEEARDLLGEVNVDIFLSRTPSPEKKEYIVRPGDVLAKIAHKLKSTPELIMRMNNLNGTMLRIGERLLISHPDFSIVIQRKTKLVVLLNQGAFFKQYHVQEVKLAPKQPARIITKVAEIMAWRGGKRVGFGTKEFMGSTRWIRLGAHRATLYAVPDATHPNRPTAPAHRSRSRRD